MTLSAENTRSFHLHVTHVDGEGHFLRISGQIEQQAPGMLESLFNTAKDNFEKGIGAASPGSIHEGLICAAKYKDGAYYRAKVINTANIANGLIGVHFIDFGNKDLISLSTIRFLDNYDPIFLQLRGQATDYYLSRVINPSGRWDEGILMKIQSLLCYSDYTATIDLHTPTLPFISIQFKGNDLSTHLVSIRFGIAISVPKQEALLQQMSDTLHSPNWQSNYMSDTPAFSEHVPFLLNQNFPGNPASAMRLQQNIALPFNGSIPVPASLISKRLINTKVSRTSVNLKAPSRQPQHMRPGGLVLSTPPPTTTAVPFPKPSSPKKSITYKSPNIKIHSQHEVYISYSDEGPEVFAVQLKNEIKDLQEMLDDINRRPHSSLAEPPMIGTVCLGRMSGDRIICRAIVMNLSGSQCKLFFVDFGNMEMVSYYDIFDIPEEYVTPKVFATRFCLSGFKTLENGPQIIETFKRLVKRKVLTLKVVPPEGPPLLQYGELYLEGESILNLLKESMTDKSQFKWLETLPMGTKHSVLVSYVDSCIKFYIQLSDKIHELNMVMEAVKAHCESSGCPGELPEGSACCARFPDDGNWYRARVRELRAGKAVVVYVDYGNEQEVDVADLRSITPDLMRLPAMAMKCALKGFESRPVESKTSNQLEMLALEKTLSCHVLGALAADTMLVALVDHATQPPLDVARKMTQLSQPRSSLEPRPEDERRRAPARDKESSFERGAGERGAERARPPAAHPERRDRPERRGAKPWDSPPAAATDDAPAARPDRPDRPDRREHRDNRDYNRDHNRDNKERNRDNRDNRDHNRDNRDNRDQNRESRDHNRENRDHNRENRDNNRETREHYRETRDHNRETREHNRDNREHNRENRDYNRDNKDLNRDHHRDTTREHNRDNNREHSREHNKEHREFNKDNRDRRGREAPGARRGSGRRGARPSVQDRLRREPAGEPRPPRPAREVPDPAPLDTPFAEPDVEEGSTHEVAVTWITSPESFYVQLLALQPEFLEMMHSIPEMYRGVRPLAGPTPPGSSVLARYPADGVLYRASVLAAQPFSKLVVQYVDFGNRQLVDARDVWPLDRRLLRLPRMALHCALLGAAPPAAGWGAAADLDACFAAPRFTCAFRERRADRHAVRLSGAGACVLEALLARGLAAPAAGAAPPAPDEPVDLALVPGQRLPCRVTHVQHAARLHVQLDPDKAARLEEALRAAAAAPPAPLGAAAAPGAHCTVRRGGRLLRAVLRDAADPALALLADLGREERVPLADVLELPPELGQLYYQALALAPRAASALPLDELRARLEGNDYILHVDRVDDVTLVGTLYGADGRREAAFPAAGAAAAVSPLCAAPVLARALGGAFLAHAAPDRLHLQRAADAARLAALLDTLYAFYEEGAPEPAGELAPGDVCAVKSADGNWYRARVLRVAGAELRVQYPDYGNCETVSAAAARRLLPAHCAPPALALEVGLGLRPAAPAALAALRDWVGERELHAAVEPAPGEPAPGDPAWRAELALDGADLAARLLAEGLAEPAEPAEPPPPDGCVRMFVSHIDTPGQFWLQAAEDVPRIERIQEELQRDAAGYPALGAAAEGAACVARYSADERWYRARVLDADSDITTVRFLDHGNTDVLDNAGGGLRAAPAHLAAAPPLAARASLDAVPTGTGEWSEAAADALARLVGAPPAPVHARVVLQDVAAYVELFVRGRSAADHLVEAGHAARAEPAARGALPACYASHVNSPAEFWLQLESATPELQAVEAALADAEAFPALEARAEGALCAARFPEDGAWYRAQVIVDGSEGTEVLFVDYGNASIADELRALPAELARKPALSRKCALQKPRDVAAWSRASELRFGELAAEGATVFTVHFIASGDISIVELYLGGRSVADELTALCEPRAPGPAAARLCYVAAHDEFYVHDERAQAAAERLADELAGAAAWPAAPPEPGARLAAHWPEDEQWYRAELLAADHAAGHEVRFLDYGNTGRCRELRALPAALAAAAPLARRCRLHGVPPAQHAAARARLDQLALEDAALQLLDVPGAPPGSVRLLLAGDDALAALPADPDTAENSAPGDEASITADDTKADKDTSYSSEEQNNDTDSSVIAEDLKDDKESSVSAEETKEHKQPSVSLGEPKDDNESSVTADKVKEAPITAEEAKDDDEMSVIVEEPKDDKQASIIDEELKDDKETSVDTVPAEKPAADETPDTAEKLPADDKTPDTTEKPAVPKASSETAEERSDKDLTITSEEPPAATESSVTTTDTEAAAATADPTPATADPTPATADPTAAAPEPAPAAVDPTPATADPTPAAAVPAPAPAAAEPAPAAAEPAPAAAEPAPAAAEPTPAAAEPAPAAAEPEPAAADPTPAAADPTPAADEKTVPAAAGEPASAAS